MTDKPRQIKLERLARAAIRNELARAYRAADMYDQQRSLNELRELIGHSEFSYEEALEVVEAIESELDI